MKRFLLVIVTVLIVAGGYGIYAVHRYVTVVVPNAYAVDWVASMVIEHMKTHDNQWPQSWEDLRDPYETLAAPQDYPWSFEDLQRRVAVDWTANVDALNAAEMRGGEPPFKVIWLTDGSKACMEGGEPNERVLRFLKTGKTDY